MNKDAILKMAFNGAVENFSDNYVNELEKKESFTIQDMQEAFKAGAKWAKDFLSVAEMLAPKM